MRPRSAPRSKAEIAPRQDARRRRHRHAKRIRIDAARAKLVGVALSLGANDALYIPLAHQGADTRAGELFASEAGACAEPPAIRARKFRLAAALGALQPLLEDRVSPQGRAQHQVGYGAVRQARRTRLAPYDDPMLISYALYGGLDSHEKIDPDREASGPRADAAR